jgi:hypothetical protein
MEPTIQARVGDPWFLLLALLTVARSNHTSNG